jgi:hypothetical protein
MKKRYLLFLPTLTASSFLFLNSAWTKPAAANLRDSLTFQEKVAFRRKSIRVLKEQVELISVLVKAGEYDLIRDYFFIAPQKTWLMFGGTVKRLSPELYDPIFSKFRAIDSLLGQANPSQSSLTSNLNELNKLLDSAVKVSDERL